MAAEPGGGGGDWGLLRRLWPYVRPYTAWLWVVGVATPVGVLVDLAPPLLLKRGIDAYIRAGTVEGLGGLAWAFVALVVVGFSVRAVGLYGLQLIGLRSLTVLRREVFGHVVGQGQRFFDGRTTGALMTRTTNDVEAVYESLSFGAVGLITDALTILGTFSVMLWLDWRLTLVAFSVSPLIVYVVNLFRKKLRGLFTEIRAALSELNGFFAEQINGMSVVQLYGAQGESKARFRDMAHHYLDRYRRANWWDAGLYAIMDGMSALSLGLLIAYAGFRVGLAGEGLTLGLLVAFIDYLNKVFVPIREFSGRFATLQRATAALERVFGLMDIDERVSPGTRPLERARGHLVFQGVGFAYRPGRPVLRDLSFEVRPGEVVAIVGATGSGKTTLGKLLQRAYDGYEGSIRLDGHELRELRLADVRRNVAVVHQDPFLFDGTAGENISLWDPAVDSARLRDAARRSRAAHFIEGWAAGYEHPIRERGGNLSVGQKQLMSIARAMARDAPIVILDEATASVDSMTEELIDEAVGELLVGKTVLVIAHRLSTVTKADRILVLHHGALVEQGSHEQLMAQGGRYKLLVETGFAL